SMDSTTITSSSFTVTKVGDGAVAGTVTYDSATNTATFTPSASLALSTTYTANLDTTVKASDGTPLAAAFSWSFTTAATSSPPTVTSTTPAAGASGVVATSTVTATFSRAMDATTIT